MPKLQPLLGCRIKIDRAKKHFGDLELAIKAYFERKGCSVIAEYDPETKQELHRFRMNECIPMEWGTLIGDCVHNLRSSLDFLAHDLVINGNGTPTDQTAFPIGGDITTFNNDVGRRLKGASPFAIGLVKRLKPYGGTDGCEMLVQMHRLNILDKHRILLPVFASHQQTYWSPITAAMKEMGFKVEGNWPAWALKPKGGISPLEDGTVLGSYGRGPADVDHSEFKFVIDVTFGEGQVFEREPVVTTLAQLIDLTERLIGVFALRVFKTIF